MRQNLNIKIEFILGRLRNCHFFLPTAYDRGRPPDPPLAEATHATRTPGANAAVSPQSQQPGELNALYDTAGYGVLLLGA
jgi:hypothetical protein